MPTARGELPFHLGWQTDEADTTLLLLLTTSADRQQIAVMPQQPGAVHRSETLGIETRQVDLRPARHQAAGNRCADFFTVARQRRRLIHDLLVLALGDFVFADEIQHGLEQFVVLAYGQGRGYARLPVPGQILDDELTVDEVAPVAGNEGLLIAGIALAERVAKADLAVVERASGKDVDVAKHHFTPTGQRQADVIRQRLGVVIGRAGLRGGFGCRGRSRGAFRLPCNGCGLHGRLGGRGLVRLAFGAGHQGQQGQQQRTSIHLAILPRLRFVLPANRPRRPPGCCTAG